jgi:hypothetical protein
VNIAQLSADDLRFVARILDTIGAYEQTQRDRPARRSDLEVALARWSDDGGAR